MHLLFLFNVLITFQIKGNEDLKTPFQRLRSSSCFIGTSRFHFQSAQQLLRTDPDLEGCKPSRVFLSYQAENASAEESGIPGEGVGHPNPRGLDLDTPALEEPWLLTVGTGLEESGHL